MGSKTSERYRIVAQNRDDRLTIEVIGHTKYFIRSAEEILNDFTLLEGFSTEQISLIKNIAQSIKKPHKQNKTWPKD